jgi:signal transduction histidine kinase
MPGGGKLCVHVRHYRESHSQRPGVLVALLDTGTGIPPPARKHLFEPFFTTKGEKGSGVGLWVSNGIVQRHGGTIRVHSNARPGRSYTCFEVFLPETKPQTLVQGTAQQPQKNASLSREPRPKAA